MLYVGHTETVPFQKKKGHFSFKKETQEHCAQNEEGKEIEVNVETRGPRRLRHFPQAFSESTDFFLSN